MFLSALIILAFPFILCDEDVKFAVIIFRHGDRTPVQPYPTDPWRNESFWPAKFGQLTNNGKRQHYILGQWLRKRYAHLLSEQYDPSQIYVRSTDVDRTLMSAQANLAGLYPPSGKSVWDPDLIWQPIPVHTVPEKMDEVLAMKKHCPAYEKKLQQYMNSKPYKEQLMQYQGLMDYLSANSGKHVKDYVGIMEINNTLYIESLYNFTLPKWTQSVYPDKTAVPAAYPFRVSTATPSLARLKVGPLLKEVTSRMTSFAAAEEAERRLKLVMYSAHDDTVASVLNGLGIFDGYSPPYTATVFFELIYDTNNSTPHVRISYRNATGVSEPRVLRVPHCGATCPLHRFQQLYENIINVDWENECGAKYLQTGSNFFGMSFFIGLGVLILVYVAHKVYFAMVARKMNEMNGYTGVKQAMDKPTTPTSHGDAV